MRPLLGICAFVLGQTLPTLAGGYICAEGGGNGRNGVWATSVFAWMVEHSGCGDVLVLGVSEPDTRIEDVFLAQGAASVTHLSVREGEADREEVYEKITAADIVWIRGGAQSNYVRWWKGTRTEQAIRDVYDRGGVVGGTSAGCAILGEVIFDALEGSLTARQALSDPHHVNVTLTDDFLQLTPGVLFDTHFTERGRLGRLVTMMGRDREESCRDVLGVGVDYRTALCVYPDFTAEVRGEGSVTILQAGDAAQVRIVPGEPPVFTSLRYDQLTEGYRYDLIDRRILSRPAYASFGRERVAVSLSIMAVRGGWPVSAVRGDFYVDDAGEESALLHGKLELRRGTGQLGGLLLSPGTWAAASYAENRMGGAQLALAETPLRAAVLFDEGSIIRFESPGRMLVAAESTRRRRSVLLLDAEGVTSTALSYFISTPESLGPRQSAALEGAVLHVLAPGMGFDWTVGTPFDHGVRAADPLTDEQLEVELAADEP